VWDFLAGLRNEDFGAFLGKNLVEEPWQWTAKHVIQLAQHDGAN
jgi:hypothetical protein